jgi:hypothetical protein
MCLMEPATVLETRPDEAVVESEGRSVVLPNFFVPDLEPGETVVIGMGHILGRLSAADAAELRGDRALARDGVAAPAGAAAAP